MVSGMKGLLAVATTASAAILELPVVVSNSYSSVEVDVGTPPKTHRLLFDSGSSTTWMVSTDCTEYSCSDSSSTWYQRQKYNASASSTSISLGSFSRIPFLGGNIGGKAYEDTFVATESQFEWNQTFISANESDWRWITADGFLGLGFSTIAEQNTSTLVETLLWEDKLDAPRFSLFHGTNLKDEGKQDGVLTIGGSHEDKYVDGEVVFAPLRVEKEYQLWRAPLRSVNVLVARDPSNPNSTVEIHNGRLPTTSLPNGTYPTANTTWPMWGAGRAVFDTGAGRLSVPDDIASAMYYNLGWDMKKLVTGEQRMGCEHSNASWAITFTLGEGFEADDVSFSMRGDEFFEPGAQCMPPFDTSDTSGFALIGNAFLQRHYTVFDFGANRVADYKPKIGFGRLKKEYDYLYQ